MAIVQLAPQSATDAGVVPTNTGSLSTGNTYKVNNHLPFLLHFVKTGANACNVTFTAPAVPSEHKATSKVVSVAATTGDKFVGPFDPSQYNNVNDVVFTVSEVTGLTVAVIALPLSHRKA